MSENRAGKVAQIAHSHWDFRAGKVAETVHSRRDFRAGKVAETVHSRRDFRAGKVARVRLARDVPRGWRMLRAATGLGTASDTRSRAFLDTVGAAHLTASCVPVHEAPARVLRELPWSSPVHGSSNYWSSSPVHTRPVREGRVR